MTPAELKGLLEKAKKATQGKWHLDQCGEIYTKNETEIENDGIVVFKAVLSTRAAPNDPNGIYVAAANPETITHIIEMLFECWEALGFYADRSNWRFNGYQGECKEIIKPEDFSCENFAFTSGGKRAREYFKKYGEK